MKKLISYPIFIILFIFNIHDLKAQKTPDFLKYLGHTWVDSVLKEMSLEQKIGQLFIVQAYSENGKTSDQVLSDIQRFHIGGIIFMQGNAVDQVVLTNRFQQVSRIPLLITMDAEWGPGFRLKDSPKYPVQMALGAIQHDSLIYQMGFEIGKQLRRIGVHVNFAPVADVNNNPKNPVINYRSFGEDQQAVARKSWLYAKGLQDAGVLAVAKHFPGHGDTKTDSHLGLPVINHDLERLETVELYPFKALIDSGIGSIMTGHLQLPALEPDSKLPSSLSSLIIKGKLIDEYHFNGLIITDGMNMQGVTNQFPSGEASARALIAGNDMLEIVPRLEESVNAVKKAVENGELSLEEIDWKCRKVLALKKWLQLDENTRVSPENLRADLFKPGYELTKRLLHEQSLTVLRNENQLLPLQKLDSLKIAVVSVGTTNETAFQRMTANYLDVDYFNLKKQATAQDIEQLARAMRPYNLLIIGIHNLNLGGTKMYGVDSSIAEFILKTTHKKQVVALFGNPYALDYIPGVETCDGLLVSYQENRMTEELAAQAIFGAIHANGKLPVHVNAHFKLNDGFDIKKNKRLKYTIPEEAGISSQYLEDRIDSLANLGLREKAYPGCQVLIAVNGKVILHKCYGYLAYDQHTPVEKDHLYDWASITKITAPLPALIRLHGERKFNLDLPFSFYWPPFRNTEKDKFTSREALAHQSGLIAGVPLWQNLVKKNGQLTSVFNDRPTNRHDIRISSNLYLNKKLSDQVYDEILESRYLTRGKYNYSDLPFLILPKIIEDLSQCDYEAYLKETFYKPLGATTVTFNPYRFFPVQRFVPTEYDELFRNELLRGFVHDEAAAMLGGVSGNAGLFGSANDLAKLMQMYLQNGYYGGEQFLDSASLAEFSRVQYPLRNNRRGLGFDKPYINNQRSTLKNAFPAVDASPASYGHTGFTGTFTWADPKNRILFIFFTNRIYPTRSNSKLTGLNLRTSMHQVIYDSLKRGI
ncbi:glycoside hydrolase family 3 N-terminal domain-containing protein [Gaoshiqia sp. Z1-71]|uniref:glycoside hydrolase family 3 N-terminal domain-containing protein n=1 Tax=Gaoshiqia hydrogeniformans TaxID=3290090 RepID=UPI003BF869BB